MTSGSTTRWSFSFYTSRMWHSQDDRTGAQTPSRDECTWFEFASKIVRRAGAKAIMGPTTSAKIVRPAEPPKYSVLSSKSLEQRNIHMLKWAKAITD